MNEPNTEQAGTPEFSFQESDNWIKEQHQKVKTLVPENVQPFIIERLDQIDTANFTDVEKKSIEVLITQALQLKKLLIQFEHHLAQAAQSKAIADTEIELFWEKFEISMLDPNEFQPRVKKYLDERYAKHAKETAVINETQKKALEASKESEAEMKSYAPYYFTTDEREQLYTERTAAEAKGPKALNKFKEKIVKLRKKKEAFTSSILNTILQNKHRPVFCQKQLERLEKICGAGIFDLPSVEAAKAEIERPMELYNRAKELKAEAESVNIQFYQEFGYNLPGFRYTPTSANDNTAPGAETADDEPDLDEKIESKETQIKAIEEARRLLVHSMSFWAKSDPKLLEDPSFTIAGGNRRKALMAANENLPSVDHYEQQEMKSAQLAQAKDGTQGLWHYRTIDVPSSTEDFTPAKASALMAKLGSYTDGGGDDMVAMTGIWYIDMAKRGGAKAKSIPMHDYLSHLDHLLIELRGQRVDDVKVAA